MMSESSKPKARDKRPAPPFHLTKGAKEKWKVIVAEWVLDAAGLMLLQGALEQWDAYQEARKILAKDGPVVRNQSGMVRQHPASLVARDSLKGFRLTLKDLGLDQAEVK
jgi:P27 family predicted phage terminase small subunit